MSFVMQYLVLRAVLLKTHKSIQTPSAFALPYDQLKALWLLWKIPLVRRIISRSQWKTCCVLHNMGLVEMKHGSVWFIAVTTNGALFLHELKMQVVKATGTVIMAIVSGLLGFLAGSL